jgi:hypothetical protein
MLAAFVAILYFDFSTVNAVENCAAEGLENVVAGRAMGGCATGSARALAF